MTITELYNELKDTISTYGGGNIFIQVNGVLYNIYSECEEHEDENGHCFVLKGEVL